MSTSAQATARAQRERDIVAAARRLFDEQGVQAAQVRDIAREVGLNKALIYRVFGSKEELFIATLTHYLDELLERAVDRSDLAEPERLLHETCERFAAFCIEYPAFLDCAMSLMRRPAHELEALVSEEVWARLGAAMAEALRPIAEILRAGRDAGVFAIVDPDLVANHLYVQVIGTMHLARTGIGVRIGADGLPEPFELDPATIKARAVEAAVDLARIGE